MSRTWWVVISLFFPWNSVIWHKEGAENVIFQRCSMSKTLIRVLQKNSTWNPKHTRPVYMYHLNKGLDIYLKHNNLLMLGDFNSELKYSCLNKFSNVSNLKNLNEEPTCFKDRNNPSCMDLFLTNNRRYFQNTSTNEIGISDSIKWF